MSGVIKRRLRGTVYIALKNILGIYTCACVESPYLIGFVVCFTNVIHILINYMASTTKNIANVPMS